MKGAQALLDWWALAGVDEALMAEPHAWLSPVEPDTRSTLATQVPIFRVAPGTVAPVTAAPPVIFPDTLERFSEWLAVTDAIPEASWPGARIMPTGTSKPALMVLVDMPEQYDTNRLMSGEEGQLFDAMLRALNGVQASVHMASLALARPAGGILEGDTVDHLAARMKHYIGLVSPKQLLILGERTAKAIGLSIPNGDKKIRHHLLVVNHTGGTVSVIATHHPRFLLRHPTEKGAAWAAMRKIIQDLGT